MKKYSILYIMALISVLPAWINAQNINGGQIPFDIDIATFRAQQDWSYLEVYLSVPRDGLSHKESDGMYVASYEIAVNIFYNDSLVTRKQWKNVDRADSPDQITKSQYLYGQAAFYLKEGRYKVRTRVTDLNLNIGGWSEWDFSVNNFSHEDLDLSDIELSMELTPDTMRTVFYKNGYRVIPNPKAIFGLEVPLMYYYSEIYNLSPYSENTDSTYTVNVSVQNSDGETIKQLPARTNKRAGRALVNIGAVNVASLHSGAYRLIMEVIDQALPDTVVREKNFFVYRQMDFAGNADNARPQKMPAYNEFADMGEEELDQHFEYCKTIATKDEKSMFKNLNLKTKRQFLSEFWKKRDQEPETPVNEFKNEFMLRIQKANAKYSTRSKKGFETDRGRILVAYGEPDDIEYHPSSLDSKAYEIWYYYKVEGSVEFCFVDIRDLGEFTLVHSTAQNQIHDYDWERWISPIRSY